MAGLHDIWRGDVMPLSGEMVSIGRNQYDPPAPFVPVQDIHQNVAVFHDGQILRNSGIIRYNRSGRQLEISTNGGTSFPTHINTEGGLSVESRNILPLDRVLESGIIKFEAINLASRPFMSVQGSGSPIPYPVQPALFNSYRFMALPSVSTSIGTYGNTVTSVGTVSHPTASVNSGVMVNLVSAATAAATAGTGSNLTLFYRGGVSGVNSGFFFATRITLPDEPIDNIRAFIGLCTGTMAASVSADDPTGDFCGFQYSTARGDGANWRFMTKDNTTQNIQDAGVACSGNRLYDMYMYSPPFPNNGAIFWTINDVSNGKTNSGYTINNLPRLNTIMRAGMQINNIIALARNIRFSHLYCESQ